MKLVDPRWLVLVGTGLLLAAVRFRWHRRPRLPVATVHRWLDLPGTPTVRLARVLMVVELLALGLLGLALANPSLRRREVEEQFQGRDFAVVLDRSSSMAREDVDFGGTRLDGAKEVLARFVEERVADRFALIGFARVPRLLAPLTRDRELVEELLGGVQAVPVGSEEDRTAIGVALAAAERALASAGSRDGVVLLLTDGENNVEGILPEEGILLCRESGIRVYGLSVGGGATARWRLSQLELLCRATGGDAFAAHDRDGLAEACRELDLREPVEVRSVERVRREAVGARLTLPLLLVLAACSILRKTIFSRVP
jgi:Ca-activated chloride channel family protein